MLFFTCRVIHFKEREGRDGCKLNSGNDSGTDEIQLGGLGRYRTSGGAAGNLVRNNALRVADDSF